MAIAVARALENREHLAVEAGTGVGKSLAYLVPAILHAVAKKKKAVVCTHTINLQEQLTEKDLPMLQRVMPVKFSFAMLKGRGNYLCTRRLLKARQQAYRIADSILHPHLPLPRRALPASSRLDLEYEPLSEQEQAVLNKPVSELNLSVRARKCMNRLGINTLGDLIQRTADELLESKNFGMTSLTEVREKLRQFGLTLRGD